MQRQRVTGRERHLTGIFGEYLVAAELAANGFTPALLLKNAPECDLLALNPKNNKSVAIQVKTRKTGNWRFKSSDESAKNMLWVALVDVSAQPIKVTEEYSKRPRQSREISIRPISMSAVPHEEVAKILKQRANKYTREHDTDPSHDARHIDCKEFQKLFDDHPGLKSLIEFLES